MAESENEDEIVFIGDARRSLPIYITTWNGSDKVWKGRVIEASTRRSDDIIGDPARKLVAIDLTRAEARERQGKSPKRMLRLLGHAGVKIFESSDGNVVVYQLGRKREDRP